MRTASVSPLADIAFFQSDDEPPKKKSKTGAGKAKAKPKDEAHGGDVWELKERATRKDWRQMHCPPLHMF